MQKHLLTAMAALCFAVASAQPTAGLVAYWSFNGNFSDAGPNSINGTNAGATATTNAAGAVNTAMAFANPGSTVAQYATHPVNANVNFGTAQDFSVDLTFYMSSAMTHAFGLYDNNLNYGGYGVWLWNPGGFLQVEMNHKGGNVGTTNGAIALNTWYHICCVRASGILKIYINGVLNNSAAEGSQTPVYSFPARFGTMFFTAQTPPEYNGHNGKIDEMRIYNRALTAAEILTLGTLPVKLTSFTATKSGADVNLQWKTQYEQNSSHFNVQRSTDGINFTTIGKVQAKENTSTESDYRYTDNTLKNITINKAVFYRLQQVDKDGRSELSSTLAVKYENSDGLLTILQNPAINELRLQVALKQQQNVQLVITDAQGRAATAKQITMSAGQTFTALPTDRLATGTYYITVIAGTEKQTLPFVKQ